MERNKHYAAIEEGIKEHARKLQTSEFNINCMQIPRNISKWVPKSKVMSNQYLMFFGKKLQSVNMTGHQWMLST